MNKKDDGFETYQKVGIAFLVIIISGIVGWTFEFLVAFLSRGRVLGKGGNFLPWMNIYAYGAGLVFLLAYKFREKPWKVFLISAIVCGALELITGWLIYTIGGGTRYWRYYEGAWAIGNINGFVCLLSVVLIGVASLALVYLVLPFSIFLARKMSRRAFLIFTISLFSIIMIDEVTNLSLRALGKPSAMDFYRSIGVEYEEFEF